MSLLTYYTYYYKNKMSNERFKMSTMLLKVMILQVFFAIFLLVLPMSCAIFFVMSDSRYSTIAVLIGGMVASTHSLTEFICIAYTIKPYREAFYAMFSNFIYLFSRNEFQAQMRPISYSVTSRNSLF
uniref:Serpentine Receptor, class H n=1 Tax=Panagrolaimus sp. PS1159 TaxID=55785 RepID=A0AC35EYT0_9BILA